MENTIEKEAMKVKWRISRTDDWCRMIGIVWWKHNTLGEWKLTFGFWFFEIDIRKEDEFDLPF